MRFISVDLDVYFILFIAEKSKDKTPFSFKGKHITILTL